MFVKGQISHIGLQLMRENKNFENRFEQSSCVLVKDLWAV
jgi:hypothetical protein